MQTMLESKSVGIDVSKEKLDIAIIGGCKQPVFNQVANTDKQAVNRLVKWLRSNNVSSEDRIVIESTGSLHWLVCLILVENNFNVCLINPLITKKYQRASVRNAKTDKIDAKRLAEIGIVEENLMPFCETKEMLGNKKYHSIYAKLDELKQKITSTYREAKRSCEKIGFQLNLEMLEDCLKTIELSLKKLRKLIENNLPKKAEKIAEIKGVSKCQISILCSAIEGKSFENKNKLIAFFGLDIKARQSGLWRGKEKLSKRGNAFFRKVLFQLGWSLSRNNEVYKEYYDRLRSDKKHYFTAILATARKFLKLFFALYVAKKSIIK